jgi:ADP-ribose pyrophosphatase YjhB (NUDIX family)
MARIDHFNNPDAPKANSVVPSTTAIVTDSEGRILLVHRVDNGLWTLPGGGMELGESIEDCAVREVKEETGLEVEITALVRIYTNPNHVIEYTDGEVRQQFSLCYHPAPRRHARARRRVLTCNGCSPTTSQR